MLKLGNWNVALPVSPIRQGRIRQHVDAFGADVWVFTEMHDSCATGVTYSHSSAPGRDGQHGDEHRWVTIASRFRLEPLPTSDAQRTAACRVCPDGSEPFLVYGTVLPWIGSTWQGRPSRGGVAYREAVLTQCADWVRLRREYPDDEFFLMGDFNQDLVGSRYYGSKANRQVLAISLKEAGLIPLTAGADDPVHRLSAPCACIDHICARTDSQWIVNGSERWPDAPKPVRGISDHFGIGVTLERAAGNAKGAL